MLGFSQILTLSRFGRVNTPNLGFLLGLQGVFRFLTLFSSFFNSSFIAFFSILAILQGKMKGKRRWIRIGIRKKNQMLNVHF
jgi:hypothetical protein